MKDEDYMTMACGLADRGRGRTSPNPLVGALVVKKGRIVAQGWHKRCGSDHAEVIALKKAGKKARGAKLYVTLEPCFHYGRTPPCVDRIITEGITSVVIGMKDPNPLTCGRSIAKLRRNGIKVKVGVLKNECGKCNEVFIKYMKTGLPFVVTKTAQTLDGKIATSRGQSQWITSPQARRFARRRRNAFDAIMVGINTVLKDNPALQAESRAKRIKKVVVDSTLKIPLKARLFGNTPPENCFVITTPRASRRKAELLRRKGVQVMISASHKRTIRLKWVLKALAKREITSVLIEGGARLIGRALEERCVDRMQFYVAPKIMGDPSALGSVWGPRVRHVDNSFRLAEITAQKVGPDLLIEGDVQYL